MAKKKAKKKVKVKKPKTYNLKSKITSALRMVWSYSPMKREALKRAEVGTKFEKTARSGRKYKAPHHKCEKCGEVVEDAKTDHIVPVVGYEGFKDWQIYIDRLMVDSSGLQILCRPCHDALTIVQKEIRKKMKEALK